MLLERPIYIIDDEPEMCRSLSLLLSTDGVPARSFGCGELFLDTLDHLPPGILVCDVMMPGVSGIELTRTLAKRGRTDPVIMIAGHADIPLAVEAMRAGAIDFIEKPFEASKILSAIATARCWSTVHQTDFLAEKLSHRERQVLEFVVSGSTSKEIARELGISPRTVETYRNKLLEKTGASGTAQLIRFGLQASAGRPSFADLAITKANG
ncbi:response regulator transcription factor [Sphingomonas aurantiaca]|jgi:two-component system response regulator FixJ